MGMAVVEVSYAEGWDADARREFGPLSSDEAEERDRGGEPYVVVRRVLGRPAPLEVHLVSWRDHYVGVWAYDELGRRTHEVDLRLLEPDRLFARQYLERRYFSPDQSDRARDAWRLTVDFLPGGRGRKVLEERGEGGGSFHTLADVPEPQRWHPRSGFGVHAAGSPNFFGAAEQERPKVLDAAVLTSPAAAGNADVEVGRPESPWRPPRPGQPGLALNELFRSGTRFISESWGEMTVAEIQHIATLRIPSGRLVVADAMEQDSPRELIERVPPGEYPLQAAVLVGEGDYYGERFPVTEQPAVRLLIGDEPPVTWEMGLSEGDDPRLLLDGHAYGFGTDGAAGSFADASGWARLSGKYRSFLMDRDASAAENIADGCIHAADEETGGDLVSFHTGGDGTYPVWLGRSDSGELVAVAVITSWLADLRPA
ncbi:DUF4241 domain-containing protein [Streptomyces sp. NPDC059866]|uniref:DUF4241 domain-containing protein n=1 Tax=Streptomyces sp. NPDC059866 TaxID=3346978 RepID=UPI0036502F53